VSVASPSRSSVAAAAAFSLASLGLEVTFLLGHFVNLAIANQRQRKRRAIGTEAYCLNELTGLLADSKRTDGGSTKWLPW
jgi:hypothetical protein